MVKVQTLEILPNSVRCPNCDQFFLQACQNCSTLKSIYAYNVVCEHGHHGFFVSQDAKTMEPVWIELKKHLESVRFLPLC